MLGEADLRDVAFRAIETMLDSTSGVVTRSVSETAKRFGLGPFNIYRLHGGRFLVVDAEEDVPGADYVGSFYPGKARTV